MRLSRVSLKGVHITQFRDPRSLPIPCAQRWTLKLAKARLWNETIDEHDSAAWQLQDDRFMSPEFDTFNGYNIRGKLRPGLDDISRPQNIIKQRLPVNSHLELQARKDIPLAENMYHAKKLYDETFHGTSIPNLYRMKKDLQKGQRMDKKINKSYKGLCYAGAKNPPSGWSPIPDATESDD
eukprot:Tbor_TRINITY_DN2396_c0_g1::TRINITY_DN2396_c0_g1_i1::g.78::m.78